MSSCYDDIAALLFEAIVKDVTYDAMIKMVRDDVGLTLFLISLGGSGIGSLGPL